MAFEASQAQWWITLCLATGVLIRSAEVFHHLRLLHAGLLQGVGQSSEQRNRSPLSIAIDRHPGWLLGLRIVAATGCLTLGRDAAVMPVFVGLLWLLQLVYNSRYRGVADASDSMYVIALGAMLLSWAAGSREDLRALCVIFLAFQTSLAYAAAAASKWRQPDWRTGASVWKSLTPYRPDLATLLRNAPVLSRLASRSVIGLELSLAVCWVLPTPIFLLVLAAGGAFHVFTTVLLGVHPFLFAFVGTYPALYFLHRLLIDVPVG